MARLASMASTYKEPQNISVCLLKPLELTLHQQAIYFKKNEHLTVEKGLVVCNGENSYRTQLNI